jgi:DnaK suppressor protein
MLTIGSKSRTKTQPRTEMAQTIARLRAQRADLAALIENRLHQDGLDHHDEAALPRRADETDDEAAAETQRSADVRSLARVSAELAQVDAALARVADGGYGRCIDCDEPIQPARLLAHPAALRCAECQGYAERSALLAARTHA